MNGLFLLSNIMSKPVINTSCGAYMTHFCSHMSRSGRAQRIYLYLSLVHAVNSSKVAVSYLPPTSSVWEFLLLYSFTNTWYYHLFICLLNFSHFGEYAVASNPGFNVYFPEN